MHRVLPQHFSSDLSSSCQQRLNHCTSKHVDLSAVSFSSPLHVSPQCRNPHKVTAGLYQAALYNCSRSLYVTCARVPSITNIGALAKHYGKFELREAKKPFVKKSHEVAKLPKVVEGKCKEDVNLWVKECSLKKSVILMVSRGTQTNLSHSSGFRSVRKSHASSHGDDKQISVVPKSKYFMNGVCTSDELKLQSTGLSWAMHKDGVDVGRVQRKKHKDGAKKQQRSHPRAKPENVDNSTRICVMNSRPVIFKSNRQPTCRVINHDKRITNAKLNTSETRIKWETANSRHNDVIRTHSSDKYDYHKYSMAYSNHGRLGFRGDIKGHNDENRKEFLPEHQNNSSLSNKWKVGISFGKEKVTNIREENKMDKSKHQLREGRINIENSTKRSSVLQKMNYILRKVYVQEKGERKLVKDVTVTDAGSKSDLPKGKTYKIKQLNSTMNEAHPKPALKLKTKTDVTVVDHRCPTQVTRECRHLARTQDVTRQTNDSSDTKYGWSARCMAPSLNPSPIHYRQVTSEVRKNRTTAMVGQQRCDSKCRRDEKRVIFSVNAARPITHKQVKWEAIPKITQSTSRHHSPLQALSDRRESREAAAFRKHCMNIRKVAALRLSAKQMKTTTMSNDIVSL